MNTLKTLHQYQTQNFVVRCRMIQEYNILKGVNYFATA